MNIYRLTITRPGYPFARVKYVTERNLNLTLTCNSFYDVKIERAAVSEFEDVTEEIYKQRQKSEGSG